MKFWGKRGQVAQKRVLPFEAMLHHMVVPMFMLNEEGIVVFWNEACAGLTGLAAREVLGTREHWRGFYPQERPCLADLVLKGAQDKAGALYAAHSDKLAEDGRMLAQNWCDLPLGKRRYLRIDAGPVRGPDGETRFVVETLQDLTAMKEAEALIASERETVASQQHSVMEALGQGLEALAHGDLQNRLTSPFPGEYDVLRRNFNAALAGLTETMQAVRGNGGSVRGSAREMAHAADDLAQGTAQTENALHRTSEALGLLTDTASKAADGTSEARRVVTSARKEAEQSGGVVREAVNAMGEIEASSRQIGNIIGVIDEIAFQTNLLALNAGVEAARAGDAGRGFAVVATEVRALAQRSADAAKEIKALVSTSGTQVEAGVRLVGEAGAALTRIVSHVEQLNQMIGVIAESARQQTAGLSDMDKALMQMNEVRGKNARLVEQAAAASHALNDDAEALDILLAKFKLAEEAEPRFRRVPVLQGH
ncbi:MAG: methyl-accepting chemotaxis protein [Acidocella sp.]